MSQWVNEKTKTPIDMQSKRIVIDVPATSGNLGPGFDVAGMALAIYNRVEVEVQEGGVQIECSGEGTESLPRNSKNIVYQAMRAVFDSAGTTVPGLRLRLINRIPISRGLGSSAAARVGGVAAANALLQRKLSHDDLLAIASRLEGHPDNVAPALFGGIVLSSVNRDGRIQWVKLPLRRPPQLIALIPDVEIPTAKARAALPRKIAMKDAVQNVGCVSMLVAGLMMGRDDLLRVGLRDRLHQPPRARLMPWLPHCIDAAIEAGAIGAVLSGAGSTILAMTRLNGPQVAEALLVALRRFSVTGITKTLRISDRGVVVKKL